MSRRRGPRVAELHPAFWFECEKCHGPVALIAHQCGEHYHPADGALCRRCDIEYPESFVQILHETRSTSPCNWWDCPYCSTVNVILSDPVRETDEVPVFAHPDSPDLMGLLEADEVPVGTVQADRYRWDVPTMRVCTGCRKPVRLATHGTNGMILLRPETFTLEGHSF